MNRISFALAVGLLLAACSLPRTPTPDLFGTAIATRATGAAGSSPDLSLTATPAPGSGEPQGKIVFTCQIFRDRRYNQICLMDADGANWRRLTPDDRSDHIYPSLAPDGESVVYAANPSGIYEIYEMDLASGRLSQLTHLGTEAKAPAISPDGSQIVFTHSDGEILTLWLMGRDGSNPHPIDPLLPGGGWDPAWSPDGSQILFASFRSGQVQLVVMDADGSNLRQVTDMDGLRGRNDWSPDGGTLATYVGTAWEREIFVIGADGSNPHPITRGGNNLAPSFSPDGGWIAFTSYRDRYRQVDGCEIYVMRLDGSDVRRLTDNDTCDWQPRWGP